MSAAQVLPPGQPTAERRLHSVPWRVFAAETPSEIPWLVRGLVAEGALVFVASPPKKGKTWVVLDLALAVVLARPFLARFEVETARPVLLVVVEGNRTALRDRIGALARGAGVDPDDPVLDALHVSHKPPGIRLSDAGWATDLYAEATDIDAALVGVDVLRNAARLRNENAAEDFGALQDNLQPITAAGRAMALAHHFGKLTEQLKERAPGERMSGSGAMYGAMDMGIFITGSERGARVLRLEFDGRDAATPGPVGVRLVGDGSGEHGSLLYTDTARFECDDAPDAADLKAPAPEIAAWIRERGGKAMPGEISKQFEIAPTTLRNRRAALAQQGIEYVDKGGKSHYLARADQLEYPAPYPAPAHPAPMRGSESAGQIPLEQAKATPHPHYPAPEPMRGRESADLQGCSEPAHPAPPTGVTAAVRGAADTTPGSTITDEQAAAAPDADAVSGACDQDQPLAHAHGSEHADPDAADAALDEAQALVDAGLAFWEADTQ